MVGQACSEETRRAVRWTSMFNNDISTRLACSTMLFRAQSLDEALEGIRAAGIEHVDLWAAPDVLPHVDPVSDGSAQLRSTLASHGLRASSVTAHSTSGEEMLQRISFASALGARTVISAAPMRDCDRREAADDVRAYGRAAQDAGVTFCLAHQAGTWMDTAEDVASFLDDIGHPRVQLSIDLWQAAREGIAFEALADAAGTRVGHIYVAEATNEGDEQALGAMFELLEERNYYGMFTFSWQGMEGLTREAVSTSVREAREQALRVSKAD